MREKVKRALRDKLDAEDALQAKVDELAQLGSAGNGDLVDTSPFEEFIAENEDSIKRCEANERVLIADSEKIEQGEAQKLRDEIKPAERPEFGRATRKATARTRRVMGSRARPRRLQASKRRGRRRRSPMSLRDQLSAISADQEKLY